jgi:hypothetical protein
MEQKVQLLQGSGQLVEARLCGMAPRHLSDFNSIWKTMLQALGAEDTFWDWARKKRLALSDDRYEAYAIEQDELTQGLLWIETQHHRSQWAIGQPLVYVEALAAAPWNRRLINPDPWLRSVGTVLLQFARKRSLDLGYQGRLGLHALPGSETFYESRNLVNFGYDAEREMVYFEYGVLNPRQLEEDDNAV